MEPARFSKRPLEGVISGHPPQRTGGPSSAVPRATSPERFSTVVSNAGAGAVAPGSVSAQAGARPYVIQRGDTLSQIALNGLKALGRPHTATDVADAVQALARTNGIANPDRIYAGERLDLKALDTLQSPSRFGPQISPNRSDVGAVVANRVPEPLSATTPFARSMSKHPVLEKTLDRAVQNGYLGRGERAAVHDRIVGLANKYRFSPDDFATIALMESDGLNPRASNGRCFGIIQFCGGPAAGAAAVGMADGADRIAERPVLEQLDLVDRYFEHNGLQRLPQVGLVDLYLTVLTPAAVRERSSAAPLPIPGTQARMLHENRDRSQPITRTSILNGLIAHARHMLVGRASTSDPVQTGNSPGKNLPLAGNPGLGPNRRPG